MQELIQDQAVALLVGVLSTFLAAAVVLVFKIYILPFARRQLSDDVDIRGEWWSHSTASNAAYTYHLSLKPRVGGWEGLGRITRSSAELGDYVQDFQATAKKRGAYVLLQLLGRGPSAGSVAVGLFLLEDRGAAMRGSWVYRPSSGHTPKSEEAEFTRINSPG